MKKQFFTVITVSLLHACCLAGSQWITPHDGHPGKVLDINNLSLPEAYALHSPERDLSGAQIIHFRDADTTFSIPLDVFIPSGSTRVSTWYHGSIKDPVRFIFQTADGTITLTDGQRLGTDDSYLKRYPEAPARIGEWTLREVEIPPSFPTAKLLAIEFDSRDVRITTPRVCTNALPENASRVWKLKDWDPSKPSSISWTSVNFYEYGWNQAALLRPAAWETVVDSKNADSVRFILSKTDGQKFWSQRIKGKELRKPLELPRLPEGSYFLEITCFGSDGTRLHGGRIVYQVLREDTELDLPVHADNTTELLLNGMRARTLSTDAEQSYELRLDPNIYTIYEPLVARWTLANYKGASVQQGNSNIAPDQPAIINLRAPKGGSYRVKLEVVDARGRTVEVLRTKLAAIAPDLPKPTEKDTLTTTPQLEREVYSLSLMVPHNDPDLNERLPLDTFPDLVEWSQDAGMTPAFVVRWGEFEQLDNCFEWSIPDSYLEMCRKIGSKAWLGVGCSGDTLPQWLWYEELMDQRQRTIRAGYHYYTPFGPRIWEAQQEMLHSMLTHYRNHPDVEGYILYAGPSEGFLTDTLDSVSDYSPSARSAFRTYLRKNYDDSLDALNQAWASEYSNWNDVEPPQPDWSRPWETASSWLDFHQFKSNFVVERLTALTSLAREAEPDRPIMAYGKEGFGSTGRLAKVFRQNDIRYTNGGGETQSAYVQTCIMRNHGIPSNPEGNRVMPNIGSVVMVAAHSILAGQFQGQDIMWGLTWAKKPHVGVPEYEHMAKFTNAVTRHSETLNQARAARPWAAYFDGLQSMLQKRSFRTAMYPEASLLMGIAGNELFNLCSWVDDDSELAAMTSFPIIVDSGSEILARHSLDTLLSYVRQGGTLLASTQTARYLPGSESPDHALVAAIGGDILKTSSTSTVDSSGSLHLKNMDTIEWPDSVKAMPLQRNKSGQPLAYRISLGKGHILLASGAIDFARSTAFIKEHIDLTTGQSLPFIVDADNIVTRPLEDANNYYLPFVLWTPDRNVNHTYEELQSFPERSVKINGLPKELTQITELISDQNIPVQNGTMQSRFMPGMLHILKIPKN